MFKYCIKPILPSSVALLTHLVFRATFANILLKLFLSSGHSFFQEVAQLTNLRKGKICTVLSLQLLHKNLKFYRNRLRGKLQAKSVINSWTEHYPIDLLYSRKIANWDFKRVLNI